MMHCLRFAVGVHLRAAVRAFVQGRVHLHDAVLAFCKGRCCCVVPCLHFAREDAFA